MTSLLLAAVFDASSPGYVLFMDAPNFGKPQTSYPY
jgi:hypothetical protein